MAVDAGAPPDVLGTLDVPALESEVRTLVALLAHPGFRSANDRGLTRAADEAYLDERCATLLAPAERRRAILARAAAPSADPDLAPSPSPDLEHR